MKKIFLIGFFILISFSANAKVVTSFTSPLNLSLGGTGQDLSATGGTSQVLRQNSSGGNITVSQLSSSDLSDSANIVTLAGSQTLTNKNISGATNNLSSIGNSSLSNSSITLNGTSISLGDSTTITANTPNSLTVSTGLQLDSGTTFNGSAAKTISIDSTVTTLTGSQTLTNKTLTTPTINGEINTPTVSAKTTNYNVLSSDSGSTLTNTGAAGAVVFTLPASPVIGEYHDFCITVAQTFEILANTGQTINFGSTLTASAGNIQAATIGYCISIKYANTNQWYVTSSVNTGAWTIN